MPCWTRFKGGTTINHFLYMDDIKLNAKDEQNIESLIHLTRVFSSDIDMTFGLAKCGHLIVNRGKAKSTSGISLPEGWKDDINENYKYLGILQSFNNNDKEVCLQRHLRVQKPSEAGFVKQAL